MTLNVDMDTTITTDQTPPSGPAIQYTADNIKVIIDTNVNVVSQGDHNAILSFNSLVGNTLVNNGNVSSPDATAVAFGGNDSSIINKTDGSISGGGGVLLGGDGAELTNHGAISGMVIGADFNVESSNVVLNNDGDIWGGHEGVYITSQNGGGVINNSGSIRSDQTAVSLTSPDVTTEIHNEAGGLIKGGLNGIVTATQLSLDNQGKVVGGSGVVSGEQSDLVINRGKIKGDVYLNSDDDKFEGKGSSKVTGDVHLGSGDDRYQGKGHSTSGHVFGEDGKDKMLGSKADDTLDGGADSDLIRGGRGKDKLFGGADSDTFDFNSIKDSVFGSKHDKIIDFQPGDDEIDLKGIDAKTGKSGNQEFKWIGKHDFHDKKGELRIKDKGSQVIVQGDVNGDGHADFDILVKVGNLHDDDFVL